MSPQKERRIGRAEARRPVMITGCALLAAFALAGCRAEEQGRITSFEKGVYQGAEDQSLDEETRRALHNRSKRQSF